MTTNGLVLGAGIAGLAMTAAARRAGLNVELVEASSRVRVDGAGVILGPPAMKALSALAKRDAVISAGAVLADGGLTDLALRPISKDAFHHFSTRTGEPFVGVERSTLMRILEDASGGCHTGTRYKGVTSSDQNVEVTLEGGETLHADWVVLADGIRSVGRDALLGPIQVRDAGQYCWRGVASFDNLGAFSASFREGWGTDWRFGFVPVGAGRVYWFVTQRTGRRGERATTSAAERHELLLAAAAAFHPMVRQMIAATPADEILENRLEDLAPMPGWHRGRVVCIGDAAHATTPNIGQGATQALEDGVILARMVAAAPGDPAACFAAFTALRKRRVDRVVSESRKVGELAHARSWKAPLRNALLRSMPRPMALKQLAWLYEDDALLAQVTAAVGQR